MIIMIYFYIESKSECQPEKKVFPYILSSDYYLLYKMCDILLTFQRMNYKCQVVFALNIKFELDLFLIKARLIGCQTQFCLGLTSISQWSSFLEIYKKGQNNSPYGQHTANR